MCRIDPTIFAADDDHPHSPKLDKRLTLATSSFTFLPLDKFTDKAASIVEKRKARLRNQSAEYPPGLREQHEVLLEMMQSGKTADGELLMIPITLTANGRFEPALGLVEANERMALC